MLQCYKARGGAPCIGKNETRAADREVFVEWQVEAMVAAIRVLMCLPCISWGSRRANEGHFSLVGNCTVAGLL